MPGAVETILNYLAAMKSKYDMDEYDKTKLGAATNIKGGSTIRKALAKLKQEGCITVEGKMVAITAKGMNRADTSAFDHIKMPTTNDEKHSQIKEDLKPKQVELFDALKDGHIHDKEEVRMKMGMEKNSTWRKLLASLVNLKIAEYPTKASIQLTQDMFPIISRPE